MAGRSRPVSIEVHCVGCGKLLKAPESSGGKWSKCPACGHRVYVPLAEGERDEIPLAPEDTDLYRQEKQLRAERLELDRQLRGETREPPEGATSSGGGASNYAAIGSEASRASADDVESMVIDYLIAMRNSDFPGADDILNRLLKQRAAAIRVIDHLVSDQIPPEELGNVPGAVYQGFLKNLRSQL
jgi:DNA-directed RNA polymerase subunit RPC12/RpoP